MLGNGEEPPPPERQLCGLSCGYKDKYNPSSSARSSLSIPVKDSLADSRLVRGRLSTLAPVSIGGSTPTCAVGWYTYFAEALCTLSSANRCVAVDDSRAAGGRECAFERTKEDDCSLKSCCCSLDGIS